jgi:exopolyphosphatase/guanosine-5'-triphosphate,3'-diphosphate pyrophosphatase
LLTRVFENGGAPLYKKESLIRIPLRLGSDAFIRKRISDAKAEMLVNTLTGFRFLINAYQPIDFMACATSAMREVENGGEIVAKIQEKSGIELKIIEGKDEAEMIIANHFEERLDSDKAYLYVDVGGGSTEMTIFNNGRALDSRSFDIGTVRLLENLVSESSWKEMRRWIKDHTKKLDTVVGIGSGGNINKIFSLTRQKTGKPITLKTLKKISNLVNSYSYTERIRILDMKPDRAEVIVHAAKIYTSVMKWGNIKHIYVPQIGLADGIIHLLYEKYKNNSKA